jgi:hypothetical protein
MKKLPHILNLKLVNSYFPFQMNEVKIPGDFKAVLTGGNSWFSVKLSWTYDLNTPPVKFNVYVKNGAKNEPGKFIKCFTIYDKKYIANYITAGRKYCYYVTAVTPKGESLPSEIIEVTISDAVTSEKINEPTLQNKNWQASGEYKSAAFRAATVEGGESGNYNVVAGSKGFFRVANKKRDYIFNSPKEDYGEKTISEN